MYCTCTIRIPSCTVHGYMYILYCTYTHLCNGSTAIFTPASISSALYKKNNVHVHVILNQSFTHNLILLHFVKSNNLACYYVIRCVPTFNISNVSDVPCGLSGCKRLDIPNNSPV